jgi:diguanylate cyclase (GGDEF)-like protein/PAS domain S-box-containing protein
MANQAQNEIPTDVRSWLSQSAAFHRDRPIHVLFIHRDSEIVDSCLHELKKARFIVSADVALTLAQGTEQFRSRSYDVVIAEYPSPNWKEPQALQALWRTVQDVPLLFMTNAVGDGSIAELTSLGAFDCVEREHIAQLPLAVRQALNVKKLRNELEEARKALRHSQSLYRALVDNPGYGIYRCDAEGELLDVNQALVTMLGYTSKELFFAANQEIEIIPNLREGLPLAVASPDKERVDPVEIEWKRKDGTKLKAKLSGRGVYDDQGNFAGHEFIAVDVTEQRTLEDHLRHQASSDSLTGLGNYGRLFEVLHAEICRTKRTQREFSLVLLDLDGLKKINDQFGHLVGDQALCRLARIVADCCRSVDSAARHGGDEFALVLPETQAAAATLVARRICDRLRNDGEEPALSVSVGIATFPPDADTIGTLLYAADRALYAMKDQRQIALAERGNPVARDPERDSLPEYKSEFLNIL